MKRGCRVAILAILVFGTVVSCPLMSLGQEGGGDPNGLELHISVTQSPVRAGQPVKVRVEVMNSGKTDVFIGSKMMPQVNDWIYAVTFNVMTQKGEGTPRTIIGGRFVAPPNSNNEPFSTALAKDWILLPVGYSYGTTTTLDSSFFPVLAKPGCYKIQATYRSQGMSAPLYYNALFRSPDKIAQLPGKSWVGIIGSNVAWVKIIPATKPAASDKKRGSSANAAPSQPESQGRRAR